MISGYLTESLFSQSQGLCLSVSQDKRLLATRPSSSVARKVHPYFDELLFQANYMEKAPQRVEVRSVPLRSTLLVCSKAEVGTRPNFCFKARMERGKGGLVSHAGNPSGRRPQSHSSPFWWPVKGLVPDGLRSFRSDYLYLVDEDFCNSSSSSFF